MSEWAIILLGIGLSMDAFAVAIASGVTAKKMHLRHAMLIALFFGFFQALMPIIGWAGGFFARVYIESFDHWLAFLLLSFIGGKMIYEAIWGDLSQEESSDPLNIYVLFTLAIATSIDALAVGITLSFINVSIIRPALEIGIITFLISLAGAYIGGIFGHLFERKLEIVGGLVLIGIGVKILADHIFFI